MPVILPVLVPVAFSPHPALHCLYVIATGTSDRSFPPNSCTLSYSPALCVPTVKVVGGYIEDRFACSCHFLCGGCPQFPLSLSLPRPCTSSHIPVSSPPPFPLPPSCSPPDTNVFIGHGMTHFPRLDGCDDRGIAKRQWICSSAKARMSITTSRLAAVGIGSITRFI